MQCVCVTATVCCAPDRLDVAAAVMLLLVFKVLN